MTKLIEVGEETLNTALKGESFTQQAQIYCSELERGNILFLPKLPMQISLEEKEPLFTYQKEKSTSAYYWPDIDRTSVAEDADYDQFFHSIMKKFSNAVFLVMEKLLSPYAHKWEKNYVAFRASKSSSMHIHTDYPQGYVINGSRILRVFMNIHPENVFQWIIGDSFEHLLKKYGGTKKLPFPGNYTNLLHKIGKKINEVRRKNKRRELLSSPYDEFLQKMHDFLLENEDFQENTLKKSFEFAPNSAWMAFTDGFAHAKTHGCNVLEQTLIIPRNVLVSPEVAPVSFLERLSNEVVVAPEIVNV